MVENVNVDNFVEAETSLMFTRLLAGSPGLGKWEHFRNLLASIISQSCVKTEIRSIAP